MKKYFSCYLENMNKLKKQLKLSLLLSITVLLFPQIIFAGVIETSALISYGDTNVGDSGRIKQSRYTASIAYRVTKVSAIELSYMHSESTVGTTIRIGSLLVPEVSQTIVYEDAAISASWIQNLVSSKSIIQPYVKVGAGRLIRKQKVTYSVALNGREQKKTENTGVIGAGLRLFLTKHMALKGEYVVYLPNFKTSDLSSNRNLSVGFSWLF